MSVLEEQLVTRRLAEDAASEAAPEIPPPARPDPAQSSAPRSRLRQVAGQAGAAAARYRHREQLMTRAIEGRLLELCPAVRHAFVSAAGPDGRVALIAFDPERLLTWAARAGVPGDFSEVARSGACLALVSSAVEAVNAGLAEEDLIATVSVMDQTSTVEVNLTATELA